MRNAAAGLMTRDRLGRDMFARGMPEGVRTIRVRQYTGDMFDLLKAYAEQRRRTAKRVHVVHRRTVWSIKEARQRLEALIGEGAGDWVQLDRYLEDVLDQARDRPHGAWLAPSARRWRWRVRGWSSYRRPSRSRPSTCASARKARSGSASVELQWWPELNTAEEEGDNHGSAEAHRGVAGG